MRTRIPYIQAIAAGPARIAGGHGASLPGATTHSRDMNRAEGDLRRLGLTLPSTGTKLSVHAIDKAMADKGLSIQQRLVAKARLASLGVRKPLATGRPWARVGE
jgi:hypothetical protein